MEGKVIRSMREREDWEIDRPERVMQGASTSGLGNIQSTGPDKVREIFWSNPVKALGVS